MDGVGGRGPGLRVFEPATFLVSLLRPGGLTMLIPGRGAAWVIRVSERLLPVPCPAALSPTTRG